MPIYQLICKRCNKLYDVMIPLKRYGEKVKCPHCKKLMEQQVAAPYFVIH